MSTSEARLVAFQEVVLCEKATDLVEQLVQVFLQWKVEGKPVCSSLKELCCGFRKKWGYTSLFKCWGKKPSVKGCVNNVSDCRYNCRRNGLKEMRWNRIKQTSSKITGKDEFRDFCLREWREGCERVYVGERVGKMCLIVCGMENCAVRFVILLMKNMAG